MSLSSEFRLCGTARMAGAFDPLVRVKRPVWIRFVNHEPGPVRTQKIEAEDGGERKENRD
jgi:hypothetical protein